MDERPVERWMLYPVRSEQIKAVGSDDVDHAEWVIRADGPLPACPVEVAPAERIQERDRYRKALEQVAAMTDRKGGDFARLGRIAQEALDG